MTDPTKRKIAPGDNLIFTGIILGIAAAMWTAFAYSQRSHAILRAEFTRALNSQAGSSTTLWTVLFAVGICGIAAAAGLLIAAVIRKSTASPANP